MTYLGTYTANFTAPGTSAEVRLELQIDYTQNVVGNYTDLAWIFRMVEHVNASPFHNTPDCIGSASIDGVSIFSASNLTYNFDLTNETIVIATGTRRVYHAADGTKSINVAGSYDGKSPLGTASLSQSGIALPTIPRATTPVLSDDTPDTGVSVAITLDAADPAFSHRLHWAFQPGTGGTAIDNKITGLSSPFGFASGSVEGASADGTPGNYWNSIAGGLDDPFLTIPHAVFEQSVDRVTRTVTLTVDTYNGTTYIGTKTATLQVTLAASQKPTIAAITHDEATVSPDVETLIGAYVQNVTKLALALTTPAGIHGSTIASRSITVAGQVLTADGTTPNPINASGTVAITATVTDSRGRVSDVATQNVTVLAYSLPTITSLGLVRALSDGTVDENGTYIRVDLNAAVQSLIVAATERNALVYRISTSPADANTWTVKTTTAPGGITFNSHHEVGTYAITDSFDVKVEVYDDLTAAAPLVIIGTISTAGVFLHLGNNGEGVGVGKYWEQGSVDALGRMYQRNGSAVLDADDEATTTDRGPVRFTTDAEAIAGTVTDEAMTPANTAAALLARLACRNYARNARFRINQREAASGASLASGAYFLDGWKSTAATNAVTWTGDGSTGRTLTIPSGKTIAQIIEGADLLTDDYLLVWGGTSQGRINSGSYGASGVPVASLTAGTNATIEFNAGTLEWVALVRADAWSGYVPDTDIGADLAHCQRYYYRQTATAANTPFGLGLVASATAVVCYLTLPVEMRTVPTLATSTIGSMLLRAAGNLTPSAIVLNSASTPKHIVFDIATSGGTAGQAVLFRSGASGQYYELMAEL